MNKYEVYLGSRFIGETWANSPQKAINNVRFRRQMRYEPMSNFNARLVGGK